jgi:hypothetical protein
MGLQEVSPNPAVCSSRHQIRGPLREGCRACLSSRAHFVACFTAANRFDLSVGATIELFSFPFPLLAPAAVVVVVPADTAPGCPDAVDPAGCCDDVAAC